uniref:Uncharacterized protein n=1 Tax=Helianthus annuus TaxID=4232 RepID=A0A251V186_HELAN
MNLGLRRIDMLALTVHLVQACFKLQNGNHVKSNCRRTKRKKCQVFISDQVETKEQFP